MSMTVLRMATILLDLIMVVACAPVTNQQSTTTPGSQPIQADGGLEPTDSAGTSPGPGSESPTPEPMPPGSVVAPDTSATPGPSLTPDFGTPVPVTVEPGQITILLSEPVYPKGQWVEATVANGFAQTIYTEDSKSDCSIAILERWDGVAWQPLLDCAMGRAPLVVAIGPGQGRTVTINPLSTDFGGIAGATEPAFIAGTYRIKFTYRLAPEPEGEEPYEAYSKTFDLQS